MANKIWAFWDEAPWGADKSHVVWYARKEGPHIKFADGEFDTLADAIREREIG